MIRVGKYNYQTKVQATTPNFTNILIHTTGPLSPYTMKDDEGVIMENWWQFSKIWDNVPNQHQPISRYDTDRLRWVHPAEKHIDHGTPTQAYWNWRQKGFHHDRWVRYPAGYSHHSKAVGSVYGDSDDYEILTYIEARKKIYFPKYREIAIKTRKFRDLHKRLQAGENIQINEVDGPTFVQDISPYNKVQSGSLEMDINVLEELINNPRQAFGHGYCLAACLMDIDLENS